MPIYAYRCEQCGHAKDVIQKFSDAPLTVCPACGADAFRKQLTAPAFQLKGSGWYVTDFRDSGKKPATPTPAATESGSGASGDSASSTGSSAPGAPAAAPASTGASAAPAAPSGSASGSSGPASAG